MPVRFRLRSITLSWYYAETKLALGNAKRLKLSYLGKIDSEVEVDSRELGLESIDETVSAVLLIASSFDNEVAAFSESVLVEFIQGFRLHLDGLAIVKGNSRSKSDGENASSKESVETHCERRTVETNSCNCKSMLGS